ncbi:hypothetical protein RQP46_003722 [Phenoliferia psychrophenolica]
MSATIHSLAPELLDHILDLVRGPGTPPSYIDARHSNSHLLSAALVSRGWAEAAQRVLWRDARIILDQEEAFPAVPEAKYPVKHLWIAIRGGVVFKGSLCLTTKNDRIGPKWSFLRSPSLRGLQTLDLDYCYGVQDPVDIVTPFPFHLTHLGLTLFATTPSAHLVRALFATSRDTLTSLRLTFESETRWEFPLPFSEEIHHIGPQLKRLEINVNERMPHKAPECFHLGRLSGLTHFTFIVPEATLRIRKYLDLLPSPATLTHLALNVFEDEQAQEITDILPHPALTELNGIKN